MFKITHFFNIKSVLRRGQYKEVQFVNASRYPYKSQEREPCPLPPPPPPPKPKDDKGFWGGMTLLFLAGGFAVYAKQTPEVRDWIIIHAPWFDDLIAIAYEENMTYGEYAKKCVEDLKNLFSKPVNDDKPKPCSLEGEPNQPVINVSEKPEVEAPKAESLGDEKPPCEIIPPPILTKNICDIAECIKDLGDSALNNYFTATAACSYYNKTVDETMHNFTIKSLKTLHHCMEERIDLVKTSLKNAEEATSDLDKLIQYLECGVQVPKADLDNTKVMIKDYQDKIKASLIQYQWENDKSVVLDQQWLMVESTVDKYTEDNQTMFPDVKYELNQLQLNGDPDLLLYHTYRYVLKLRAELNEVVAGMKERATRGVESLQGDKQSYVQSAIKSKRAEMENEFKKRYADLRSANDKALKDGLKRELEKQQKTLQNKLLEKEREMTLTLNKMVAVKVAYEKKAFTRQLDELGIKLKLVEAKLEAHLKAERETKRSQELWNAGASLLAATKKGDAYIKVDKELKAIEKASGDGDKLVTTVLNAIPQSVRDKGVVPESVLKSRYHQMEKTALKVALVEREGAPLPVYFLSWLQSALLFMKISGIPQAEVDKPPKEPLKDLDTYDLLQRARFWVEKGNIAAAIRYVGSLEGASRVAAASWHDAARAHLETRQAAEAVLAHAAAMGLQYI